MAQRGRPPKPIEQKKKLGNPGRRPLPEDSELQQLPRAIDIPEPPRPLLQPGRELWDRIWQLGADWISPDSDLEILLLTCEMIDERWNLRIRAMQDQDLSIGRRVDRLQGQIVENLSLLGLTPADRTRLGVARVKARSKVEEMIARSRLHGMASPVDDSSTGSGPAG